MHKLNLPLLIFSFAFRSFSLFLFAYSMSLIFTFSTFAIFFFNYFVRINSEFFNESLVASFSPAIATWYNEPYGAGSGGACGLENDVAYPPYYGMISAGNNNLFKLGKGCGACYQVKCTNNPFCSGYPIRVTITDECPGACNNEAFHFDLSGKAFGKLAKPGQGDNLRKAGRINIQYRRVNCYYRPGGLTFKISKGSNRYFLAFAIEGLSGDGDIGLVEILSSSSRGWIPMQQLFGATWKIDLPNGLQGPYSVRITTLQSRKNVVARNVIPGNWAPGQYFRSTSNVG